LDTLRKDPRFSKVLVLGHSEGSLLGMLLAQKRKVDGYISVSGIAQGIDEVINEQLRPQAIPDSVKDTVKNYLATLKQGKTIPKLMQNMVIFSLFRTSIQPYMISWLRYNPSQEITKITTPILIVQGSADIQVGEKEGQALHQATPKSTYLMIPQMNHVLKLGTLDPQESQRNYQNPDLPLAPQLVEGIVEWIKNVVNYPFMNTLFKALNDPTRREILSFSKTKTSMLVKSPSNSICRNPVFRITSTSSNRPNWSLLSKKGNLSNTRSI
jgi:hypothetical protein